MIIRKQRPEEHTVSVFLSLPALVELQHTEEHIAGQTALAPRGVGKEQLQGRLQWRQTSAGRPDRIQRGPRVPSPAGLAAAVCGEGAAAGKREPCVRFKNQPQRTEKTTQCGRRGYLSFLRRR